MKELTLGAVSPLLFILGFGQLLYLIFGVVFAGTAVGIGVGVALW